MHSIVIGGSWNKVFSSVYTTDKHLTHGIAFQPHPQKNHYCCYCYYCSRMRSCCFHLRCSPLSFGPSASSCFSPSCPTFSKINGWWCIHKDIRRNGPIDLPTSHLWCLRECGPEGWFYGNKVFFDWLKDKQIKGSRTISPVITLLLPLPLLFPFLCPRLRLFFRLRPQQHSQRPQRTAMTSSKMATGTPMIIQVTWHCFICSKHGRKQGWIRVYVETQYTLSSLQVCRRPWVRPLLRNDTTHARRCSGKLWKKNVKEG